MRPLRDQRMISREMKKRIAISATKPPAAQPPNQTRENSAEFFMKKPASAMIAKAPA